jgi:hypothetical protein
VNLQLFLKISKGFYLRSLRVHQTIETYPVILEILNLEGKSLKMMKFDTNNATVDLSDLNSAIYLVKVTTGKNTTSKKFRNYKSNSYSA